MKQKYKETVPTPRETENSTKTDKTSDAVKYDPERKSWLGPVTGSMNTMKETKVILSREEQLRFQKEATLQHNRKKVRGAVTPDLNEDTMTAPSSEDFLHSADINQPFSVSLQESKSAKWGAQVLPSDRNVTTTFEKPSKKDSNSSHFLSPTEQVKRLEKDLEKRDEEISLLRKHLEQAHRENNKLVEKLKSYSGKHYQDIAKENKQLKEAYRRENKKVLALEADAKKKSNTKLQEIKYKQELEEKHASEWQRNNNKSNDSENLAISFKFSTKHEVPN